MTFLLWDCYYVIDTSDSSEDICWEIKEGASRKEADGIITVEGQILAMK